MSGESSSSDESRVDRRVLRTRKAIQEAFFDLLQTTELSKISVSGIARKANINRKTFYLHYDSVDDLVRSLIRESLEETVGSVDVKTDAGRSIVNASSLVRSLLKGMFENTRFSIDFLRCVDMGYLINAVKEPLVEIVRRHREEQGLPEVSDLDYYIAFYIGGTLAVYDNWYNEHAKTESLESVLEMIGDLLTNKGFSAAQVYEEAIPA